MYPELLIRGGRLVRDLGLEEVREPQSLGLGRRVHVLVRDATDVDVAEVLRDLGERPLLGDVTVRPDAPRPDDSVDIVCAGGVSEAVPLRVERGDLLALEEVERVDARRPVAVGAQRVDVAQERGVGGAVLELRGAVCVRIQSAGARAWARMCADTYNLGAQMGGLRGIRMTCRGMPESQDAS